MMQHENAPQALRDREADVVTRPMAVLIGPPGAGKTTVGTLIAGRLGVTASPRSGRWRRTRWPWRWTPTTGCWRWAAAR